MSDKKILAALYGYNPGDFPALDDFLKTERRNFVDFIKLESPDLLHLLCDLLIADWSAFRKETSHFDAIRKHNIPVILLVEDTHSELREAVLWRAEALWIKHVTTTEQMTETYQRIIKNGNKHLANQSAFQVASEEKSAPIFKTAVEMAPVSVAITNRQGNLEYVNREFCKSTGYATWELIGKNPRILKSGVHDRGYYNTLWEQISNGKIWQGEICNRRKDGSKYWEKQLIVPIKNGGMISNYLAIRIDDTERRRADEALRKAEALNSVKELAGGVAHEFSQPLQVLTIDLSVMEENGCEKKLIERCQRMTNRIVELVDYLKKITVLKRQPYLNSTILDLKKSSESA